MSTKVVAPVLTISRPSQPRAELWRPRDILVPIDFSEASVQALRHASTLAASKNAHLTMLTVIEEPVSFCPLDAPCRQRCQIEAVTARLRELRGCELPPEIDADIMVCEGNVTRAITSMATQRNVDLIVIARQQRRGFRQWLRMDIASRVTSSAPCPVLVVNAAPSGPRPSAEDPVNLLDLGIF